jgi:hypothetical protein
MIRPGGAFVVVSLQTPSCCQVDRRHVLAWAPMLAFWGEALAIATDPIVHGF